MYNQFSTILTCFISAISLINFGYNFGKKYGLKSIVHYCIIQHYIAVFYNTIV